MSEQNTVNIKQRLVGALVLVSLGVIFIPLLLNGGPDSNTPFLDKNIPEMPQKLTKVLPNIPQPMTIPAQKKVNARPVRASVQNSDEDNKPAKVANKQVRKTQKTESKVVSVSKKNNETKTQSIKPAVIANTQFEKAVKPVNSKINMAYTLQIASFSQKNNALALQNKLRKKKFKAYIESLLTTKGRIYRLRVGPYLKFAQIEKIKKQIENQFKMKNTVIVKYKT